MGRPSRFSPEVREIDRAARQARAGLDGRKSQHRVRHRHPAYREANFYHRSCARCARTGGTGHSLCRKRSMNTGLGEQGTRRLSVGGKSMAGVTLLKSDG